MSRPDPLDLAVEYLRSTRRRSEEARGLEEQLAALDPSGLAQALAEDDARLAFWIDVYNGAAVRHGMRTMPSWPERLRYFRRPLVTVAGRRLSLDAIEHGILRRSKLRLSLGYLSNPRPSRFERTHRVHRLDARIHFALNCGVASCPRIAAYEAVHVDEQLERATVGYLRAETELREASVVVPALLLWYLGDFGGRPGIRRLLRRCGIDGWDRRIRFKRYDWTPAPGKWAPADRKPGDREPASREQGDRDGER
jgi:hypothetical protein